MGFFKRLKVNLGDEISDHIGAVRDLVDEIRPDPDRKKTQSAQRKANPQSGTQAGRGRADPSSLAKMKNDMANEASRGHGALGSGSLNSGKHTTVEDSV